MWFTNRQRTSSGSVFSTTTVGSFTALICSPRWALLRVFALPPRLSFNTFASLPETISKCFFAQQESYYRTITWLSVNQQDLRVKRAQFPSIGTDGSFMIARTSRILRLTQSDVLTRCIQLYIFKQIETRYILDEKGSITNSWCWRWSKCTQRRLLLSSFLLLTCFTKTPASSMHGSVGPVLQQHSSMHKKHESNKCTPLKQNI